MRSQEFPTPLDRPWHYFTKIAVLAIFLLSDLTLNATTEFENFNYDKSNFEVDQILKVHILLCSFQLLCQMSSFTIIFSLLCDTFPFQIGLIGVLFQKFKSVIYLCVIYILMTLVLCSFRLVRYYNSL